MISFLLTNWIAQILWLLGALWFANGVRKAVMRPRVTYVAHSEVKIGYAPGRNLLDGTIVVPSDGDPAQAEVVVQALRELMENSVYSFRAGYGKPGALG